MNDAYLQALREELERAKDPQHIADVKAEIARVGGGKKTNRRKLPAAETR